MSQYLSFSLKKKDNPDIRIELGWWSTTPSRSLSSEGIFNYTEEAVLVTPERYQHNMKDFESYLQDLKESINREKARDLRGLFQGCKTTEAAKEAYDLIFDSEAAIKELTEDYELYKAIYKKIELFWNIAEENEGYDLFYTNC